LTETAGVPVPGYQEFCAEKRASLQTEYQVLVRQYPDVDTQYGRLYKILCDIEDVAGYTPNVVGNSAEWTAIVSTVDTNRAIYCKALTGKTLFSVLYEIYTVISNELRSLMKASTSGRTITKSRICKASPGRRLQRSPEAQTEQHL
jgi:hypothetical protein